MLPHLSGTHLPLYFVFWSQRRHRVDDEEVDRAASNQALDNLERLLPGVRLRDKEVEDVNADALGILGVERVLGVDKRAYPALFLCFSNSVEGKCRFAGRFRAEDFNYAPARVAADPECPIKSD